jgi:ATP-binding cassette subfamily B protein
MAGLHRVEEIMSIEPAVREKEDAGELVVKEGRIDIDHVSFSYEGRSEVLHDVDLHAAPGEMIAVVGASGGGKTTLCQLIPRFYDVTGGAIRIDGEDIRDVTKASLRSSVGIVQQEVFIFADTIMENIRYGRPDASDEEVFEAARKAEIYDDILEMQDEFQTYVGERGAKLSGGQRQRISIARIFLKNPAVLILDEATSALDTITEQRIQHSFEELMKGRTSFVIAHRLSTVRGADRIVVIEEGRIVEEGSHRELLQADGEYAKLYRTQELFRMDDSDRV